MQCVQDSLFIIFSPDLDSVDLSSSRTIAPPSFAPPGSVSPSDLSPASSCCRQPSCAGSPPPGDRSGGETKIILDSEKWVENCLSEPFHRPCNLGHLEDLHQSAIHGQRSNPEMKNDVLASFLDPLFRLFRGPPGLFDNLEDLRSREFQTNAVH